MAKKIDIKFTIGGKGSFVSQDQFEKKVLEFTSKRMEAVIETVKGKKTLTGRGGPGNIIKFIQNQQDDLIQEIRDSITAEWSQAIWEGNYPGRVNKIADTGGAPGTTWNQGTPLLELLQTLPVRIKKSTTPNGFQFSLVLDLKNFAKKNIASASPSSEFEYWVGIDQGIDTPFGNPNAEKFEGKHFMFTADGNFLPQHKKILERFVNKINVRIRSAIRSAAKSGK